MSLPAILSTQQKTQQRQLDVAVAQYALLCPNDVVWQTQPNDVIDGSIPYAEFVWSGTDQGNRADVLQGMTVIISTTTEYRDTQIYRGRIRIVPSTTTFFIDETSVNLAVTDYVTVIHDFDIHEKQENRTPLGQKFIDWDKSYSTLPPVISNLQSVYLDVSGDATIEISFAPTVTPFELSATISTYNWLDIGDGTITVGTAADKDVTIQFPGAVTNEHRWVYFQATDSNGVIQYFAFEVYTVDLAEDTSSVIKLDTNNVNITNSAGEGSIADARFVDEFSSVLDRTRCTIFSVDDYDGVRSLTYTSGGTTEIVDDDTISGATSGATALVIDVVLDSGTWAGGDAAGTLWIKQQRGVFEAENLNVGASSNVATIAVNSVNPPLNTRISMIGRIIRETDNTRGDIEFSQIKDSVIKIEGFAAQLSSMRGAGLYVINSATSNEWGQIKTLTIGRMAVYMLQWYSTFLNVCSFTLPSDINDYEWPSYTVQPQALRKWLDSIIDDINSFMIFAPTGECFTERHASYAGVGGLDTIMDFVVDDSGESDVLDITIDMEYIPTTSSTIAGAASYNTTLDRTFKYKGRAPAKIFGPGWEQSILNGQLMKSDLTDAQARVEAGNRVASHLEFINPKPRITVTLPTGYYWIVPTYHQLYTFTIAANDNTAGRAFTTSDKWICVDMSYSHDAALGAYAVSGTFELVTSGGNYGIVVTEIVDVADLFWPDLPPVGAGLALNDMSANYANFGDDYLPGLGADQQGPGVQSDNQSGCDTLNVNMRSSVTVETANNTVNGETYTITVQGDGVIGETDFLLEMLNGNGQGNSLPTSQSLGLPDTAKVGAGVYNSGGDYYNSVLNTWRINNIEYDFATLHPGAFIKQIKVLVHGDRSGSFVTGSDKHCRYYFDSLLIGGSTYPSGNYTNSAGSGTGIANEGVNYPVDLVVSKIYLHASMDRAVGDARITTFNITLRTQDSKRGDAFYQDYDDENTAVLYAGIFGLVVNGAKPGNIPIYSSNHKYVFAFTGDGFPITFKYNQSVSPLDIDNVNLVVSVCGPNMALTQI